MRYFYTGTAIMTNLSAEILTTPIAFMVLAIFFRIHAGESD
jgi:hypothetical protein